MRPLPFFAAIVSLCLCGAAKACNIADVLFGRVKIEQIQHKGNQGLGLPSYETGIIFGNDFDSKRFSHDKILGRVSGPERDGSRRIDDVNGDFCAKIQADMSIDNSDADCGGCSKTPVYLRKLAPNAYVVMLKEGTVAGTIEGRLPNEDLR